MKLAYMQVRPSGSGPVGADPSADLLKLGVQVGLDFDRR